MSLGIGAMTKAGINRPPGPASMREFHGSALADAVFQVFHSRATGQGAKRPVLSALS
jgi:hypothetical protein